MLPDRAVNQRGHRIAYRGVDFDPRDGRTDGGLNRHETAMIRHAHNPTKTTAPITTPRACKTPMKTALRISFWFKLASFAVVGTGVVYG